MLRELKIKNLALLETLDLTFTTDMTGQSVLTGETGAGKSIILQAIHLLGGGKGASNWIRSGAENATVEAFFEPDATRNDWQAEFKEQGLAGEDGLVIKRILSAKGRGRYYINGSLANSAMVSGLCRRLLSIASQHDQQQLLDPRQHLEFIDAAGNLLKRRQRYFKRFTLWQEQKKTLGRLTDQEKEKEQRRDFLEFQGREIRDANINLEADQELFAEKKRFKSSEALNQLGHQGLDHLNTTIRTSLAEVRKTMDRMAELDPDLTELATRISDTYYEIEDQTERLGDYLHTIPSDPNRLDEIEVRIDVLTRLQRKYGGSAGDLQAVLDFLNQTEKELAELENMDQKIEALKKELAITEKKLLEQAGELSSRRSRAAEKMAKALQRELQDLNFAKADFAVTFHPTSQPRLNDLTETGWDRPEFMFSANPGEPLKPLVKVASGGELSRLMLGIRCLLARRDQTETVILDEIDAGIGGQAAEAIAAKIKELAGHHQVLCITHLPQIAARADEHFLVSKEVKAGRTQTSIAPLTPEARIQELGRMLAGDSATEKILSYARDLLEKD